MSPNHLLSRVLSIPERGPEISDRIIAFDSETLARRPVTKQALEEEFLDIGNAKAARIVGNLPALDGILDPDFADALLVRAHCEMQRISEEFQHGRRVAELLNPLMRALRDDGFEGTVRIVDIGCGTGFVVRWLTAKAALDDRDFELLGVDYHPALVKEAQRLAQAESLSCNFIVANAFRLAQPATIYLSTGILHHFRGDGLVDLFKQHNRAETCGLVHFDFHASVMAPFGSWLFHVVRMREALARHDGTLSAVRAYGSQELLAAARTGAPGFSTAIYGTRLWRMPIPRVFHALVGILPKYHKAFVRNMGRRVASLGVIE